MENSKDKKAKTVEIDITSFKKRIALWKSVAKSGVSRRSLTRALSFHNSPRYIAASD